MLGTDHGGTCLQDCMAAAANGLQRRVSIRAIFGPSKFYTKSCPIAVEALYTYQPTHNQ